MRRAQARLRLSGEGGYSLVELLTVMAILGTVMAAITTLMTAGMTAEAGMNRRFQAQTEARLGLDKLRREVHCATSASPIGAAATVTLTLDATCPTAGGSTSITWCTKANGTGRYGLWRYTGSVCSGTGFKVADYLTTANAFSYATSSGSRAKLSVTLAVNLTPSSPGRVYTLEDDIVLRNSVRS